VIIRSSATSLPHPESSPRYPLDTTLGESQNRSEYRLRIASQECRYLIEDFRSFPKSHEANIRTVPQLGKDRTLHSKSYEPYLIHHSPIVAFDATGQRHWERYILVYQTTARSIPFRAAADFLFKNKTGAQNNWGCGLCPSYGILNN
jgi:hypothetical protein